MTEEIIVLDMTNIDFCVKFTSINYPMIIFLIRVFAILNFKMKKIKLYEE